MQAGNKLHNKSEAYSLLELQMFNILGSSLHLNLIRVFVFSLNMYEVQCESQVWAFYGPSN